MWCLGRLAMWKRSNQILKFAFAWALFFVLASCGGGTVSSSGDGGTRTKVIGQIVSQTGVPIEGVRITVLETGEFADSNARGFFEIFTEIEGGETTFLLNVEMTEIQVKLLEVPAQPAELTVTLRVDSEKNTAAVVESKVKPRKTPTPTPSRKPRPNATATPPIPTPTPRPAPTPISTDPLNIPIYSDPPTNGAYSENIQIVQGYVTVDADTAELFAPYRFPQIQVMDSSGFVSGGRLEPNGGVFQYVVRPPQTLVTVAAYRTFQDLTQGNALAQVTVDNLPTEPGFIGLGLHLTHELNENQQPIYRLTVTEIKTAKFPSS